MICRAMTIKRNSMRGIAAALIALSVCLLASCGGRGGTLLFAYSAVENAQWDVQDVKTFAVDSVAESGTYRLGIVLRNTGRVEYQSISVVAEQIFHNPEYYRKDTVVISLTDSLGNMEGDGFGLSNHIVAVNHALSLQRGQRGVIRLYHIMRRMQVGGITDVGIKIENEDCCD